MSSPQVMASSPQSDCVDQEELHIIVPAAGVGSRMQTEVPKQYLEVCGKPILLHTLERLSTLPNLSSMMVVIASHDSWFNQIKWPSSLDLKSCLGGGERFESVLAGLNALEANGVTKNAWVMVHDAARPCVDLTHLLALYHARNPAGAFLGLDVRDTMKRTNSDFRIVETVDRQHLWHAQTPQLAPLDVLKAAIERCIEDGVEITDETSALEYVGLMPKVVPGHPMNIKVTRPEDLELVRLFIQAQPS